MNFELLAIFRSKYHNLKGQTKSQKRINNFCTSIRNNLGKLNNHPSITNTSSLPACGGILRDSSGDFLFGFSHKIDLYTSLEVELWGLYHDLNLAWGKGYRNIIVESNFVQAISDLNCNAHSLFHLTESNHNICSREANISWCHVHRESNKVADILARKGVNMLEICSIYSSPSSLISKVGF